MCAQKSPHHAIMQLVLNSYSDSDCLLVLSYLIWLIKLTPDTIFVWGVINEVSMLYWLIGAI